MQDHASQLSPEAQRLLNHVSANTKRMGQLVEDLLRLCRLGQQPLAQRPVSMSALVHEALDELRHERGDRDIEVRVGELPDCHGDPSLLKQVLVNLLSNAFKFTRQKEKAIVEVSGTCQEGRVVYSLRDNGVGFDMRYIEKLFGVFQRLHRSSEFEGTGVGLSLVQRIIKRHGGRVWAESELLKGATFYFSLPRKESAETTDPQLTQSSMS